jgi:hypothetical protein
VKKLLKKIDLKKWQLLPEYELEHIMKKDDMN